MKISWVKKVSNTLRKLTFTNQENFVYFARINFRDPKKISYTFQQLSSRLMKIWYISWELIFMGQEDFIYLARINFLKSRNSFLRDNKISYTFRWLSFTGHENFVYFAEIYFHGQVEFYDCWLSVCIIHVCALTFLRIYLDLFFRKYSIHLLKT